MICSVKSCDRIATGGYKLCKSCRQYHRERKSAQRQQRLAEKRCIACGNRARKTLCHKCMKRQGKANRRWRDKYDVDTYSIHIDSRIGGWVRRKAEAEGVGMTELVNNILREEARKDWAKSYEEAAAKAS